MGRERLTLLVLALSAAMGCVAGGEVEPLPLGDMELFAREVAPELSERCASGGCHGDPERPLSLYAPGMQRQDPRALHLDTPLTEEELEANAARVSALALDGPLARTLALCKPLAEAAGGCFHGGGDVYLDTTDAGYRVLEGWLRGRDLDEEAP